MLSSFEKDLPSSSAGKESACNAGDPGWIPGSGRSPGEGNGYSGLENSMDCMVRGVAKSWTRLSDVHFSLGPNLGPSPPPNPETGPGPSQELSFSLRGFSTDNQATPL